MANLIITVISIALVAVAALMGAWYGGGAFLDGKTKSQAIQIQNAMEQISAAIQLYEALTGRTYQSAMTVNTNIGTVANTALLVPKLLNSMPPMPNTDPGFFWTSIGYSAVAGPAAPNQYYLSASSVGGAPNLQKICAEIAKISRGVNAMPLQSLDWWAPPGIEKFDCFFHYGSTPTTFNQCLSNSPGCSVSIIYRVF